MKTYIVLDDIWHMLIYDIEGLFIESWSGSSGYSTEMLTEGAQSWRVEDESTWAPSVNIEVEYLELSEYDEIEWPDSPTFLL